MQSRCETATMLCNRSASGNQVQTRSQSEGFVAQSFTLAAVCALHTCSQLGEQHHLPEHAAAAQH
eukprot:4371281-Prymnesium_polylepis.1